MIFRTAIEEIIVRTDQDKKTLDLVVHWKGGAHTQLAVERPRSATETATPIEALEIIRRMAVRCGDGQIASVLNRRGYSTGKGKRWNQTRVATARRNHSIAGQKRALPDPERVGLSEAARICAVSHHTIQRLVEAGLLKREQVTPRAPWEIRRSDLDAEPILSIVERREAGEQGGAIRCGVGGAKGRDQGECGSAKHAPGSGTGKCVTGAGTHTASCEAKEEGKVHRALPPHQCRTAQAGVFRN